MSDGETLSRWTVCGRCHAVRGGLIGTVDGVTVWQRCHCVPAEGLLTQPRVGDFNAEIELCRACGLVPLRSGSRWSVWFCGPCATQGDAPQRACRSLRGPYWPSQPDERSQRPQRLA